MSKRHLRSDNVGYIGLHLTNRQIASLRHYIKGRETTCVTKEYDDDTMLLVIRHIIKKWPGNIPWGKRV
jgi:hypothetical protein